MITFFIGMAIGAAAGYFVCVYFISRDPELVRLQADEAVIKKPAEGLILAAVPPETLRKIVTIKPTEPGEARALYQK